MTPKKANDLHRELNALEKKNLGQILSVQNRRCVNNDFTVRFQNRWFQLKENQPIIVRKGDDIIIEERTNGKMYLSKDGKYLDYAVLTDKPPKIIAKLKEEGIRIDSPKFQKRHLPKEFWHPVREPETLISYNY